METFVLSFIVTLLAVFVWVWLRREAKLVTVYDHEAGVRYIAGKFAGIVGAGRHATWPGPIEIVRIDMREQSLAVPGQEMLTADKLTVRASLVISYRIADAQLQRSQAAAPFAHLYQAAQIALRERIAARTLDDLLADRGALADGLAEDLDKQARPLGLAVSAARLLDLTISGPVKQAYADLWKAQKEGLAALERARGEQAALRALANAARMLKGNPELMNLRLLQALAAAPGKAAPTIVLGGGAGLLPVASASDGDAPPAEAE